MMPPATITTHRDGFGMLDKVASYESTSVYSLPVQSGPQNKEFSCPHPILAILTGKNMVKG